MEFATYLQTNKILCINYSAELQMRITEFFTLVFYDNWVTYCILLLCLYIVFIPVFRKYIHGVLDPFCYNLVFVIMGYAIPFLLYISGYCSINHLSYFVLSEILFWLSFVYFSRFKKPFASYAMFKEESSLSILYGIALFVFLFTNLYTYMFIGIPLFLESRQELYTDTPAGSGLLGRLSAFALYFILLYSFYMVFDKHKRKYAYIWLLVAIQCFLSGSKGAIIIIIHTYFIYQFFFKKSVPKLPLKYFPLLLLFPLCVLIYSGASSSDGLWNAFLSFTVRLVANGDVYWMAYPYDDINLIHYEYPLLNFFAGILGPFRIVPYDFIEPSTGLLLQWEVEPTEYGKIAGPNARIAILTYAYFKWGGLVLCIFLGWLTAFLMYYCRKYFPNSFIGILFYGFLYKSLTVVIIDPVLMFSHITNLIFNVLLYGFMLMLILRLKLIFVRT